MVTVPPSPIKQFTLWTVVISGATNPTVTVSPGGPRTTTDTPVPSSSTQVEIDWNRSLLTEIHFLGSPTTAQPLESRGATVQNWKFLKQKYSHQ
jgi:hypothetical protein